MRADRPASRPKALRFIGSSISSGRWRRCKLYLAAVFRPLALAVLVFAFAAAHAEAATQQVPIVVVPGLELEDLRALAAHGAVGLLIPANGPTTSAVQARAAL